MKNLIKVFKFVRDKVKESIIVIKRDLVRLSILMNVAAIILVSCVMGNNLSGLLNNIGIWQLNIAFIIFETLCIGVNVIAIVINLARVGNR